MVLNDQPQSVRRRIRPLSLLTAVVAVCFLSARLAASSAPVSSASAAGASTGTAVLTAGAAAADDRDERLVVTAMTTVLIQDVQIAAREAGVIKSCDVRPGDRVQADQQLLTLDDERQLLAVRAAELNLETARLNSQDQLPVQAAQSAVREAEQEQTRLKIAAEVARRQAESDITVRLAEKIRDAAQFELERARKAREAFSGSVSPSELNRLTVLYEQRGLEIEQAREDRAVAELRKTADATAVLRQTETVSRSRVLQAQAERELLLAATQQHVAENELALARLQLERRRITAPFAGTVAAVEQQVGEWVEPGVAVLRLVQLERLRVEGFVDAGAAMQLAGRAVRIRFPTRPQLPPVDGSITFVSPEIDPVNQQVRLWAEFDNAELRVQPGLVAEMEVVPAAAAGSAAPAGERR